MSERHQFGASEEMYLKTVFVLAETQDPVPVTALAERLKITTVSASEMVRRLQERDYLEHTPYKGVRLTAAGERQALAILRRHRLWERFLSDHLGLGWARVHDAACELEHLTDEEVIDALDRFLGWPESCPHGNPIPRVGELESATAGLPLSALRAGDEGVVLSIRKEEAVLLAHLDAHGVRPGRRFRLVEIAPYDGPRSLQIGDEMQVIGRKVAEGVLVRKDGPEDV
ncbi:MAG: metal-dependent transcriptional regulator [Anaerolineales bacterium]|jgi:DtxR family Mn-dependent transcriptional regulator